MTTISIITIIIIVIFIIRAVIKRNSNSDGSINERVSWDYIKSNLFSSVNRRYKNCPKCGLESEKLEWFKFRTSSDSWRHLAGREGFYSKCPDCKINVDDIVTVMN
jgi:hypothetical protein